MTTVSFTSTTPSKGKLLASQELVDAVDGAYTAASRWHRMVASKREIQRAEGDVADMKEASAQIGQTNW